MTTRFRSPSAWKPWAAILIIVLLAVFASTFLPPECDGLPGFDDNDADSGGLALVVRISDVVLPAIRCGPALSLIALPFIAAANLSLPDSAPPRLLPSRSPPA